MIDLTQDLEIHLRLDAIDDGVVQDASGQNRDAVAAGAPRAVVDEEFGSCLSFDGVQDRLALPGAAGAYGLVNHSFTVTAWIRLSASAADQPLLT